MARVVEMYGRLTRAALPSEDGSELQVFSLMLNVLHDGQISRRNPIHSVVKSPEGHNRFSVYQSALRD